MLALRFSTDTEEELELVRQLTLEAGAYAAVVANHWAKGGEGAAGMNLFIFRFSVLVVVVVCMYRVLI